MATATKTVRKAAATAAKVRKPAAKTTGLSATEKSLFTVHAKAHFESKAQEMLELMLHRTKADPDKIFTIAMKKWINFHLEELTPGEKKKYHKMNII